MSTKSIENFFKFIFFLAVIVFSLVSIAVFLMIIKIILLFVPEGVVLMGIKMTPDILNLAQ